MAKNSNNNSKNKETYKFPSRFGSHTSMVDEALTKELNIDGSVVCRDEHGTYTTCSSRLDNKMADPNRYTASRLEYLCKQVAKAEKEQ